MNIVKKIYDATKVKPQVFKVHEHICDWLDAYCDVNKENYDVYYNLNDNKGNTWMLIFNVCLSHLDYDEEENLIGFRYTIKDVEIIF